MTWWLTLFSFLRRKMKVDIIVAIGGFSALMVDPLKNEYIYLKVAESYNSSSQQMQTCGSNNSNTSNSVRVEQEVSQLTLYLSMTLFIPACIAGMILMSWSDKIGRKRAMSFPLIGMIASSVLFALSIKLNWPLSSLYLQCILAGVGGYYMTLMMQGIAYISDITPKDKRGVRFIWLETILGISCGLAGVLSGIWVGPHNDYFHPVAFTAISNTFALLLIPLLPDSMKLRDERKDEETKKDKINIYVDEDSSSKINEYSDEVAINKRKGTSSSASDTLSYGSTDNNNLDHGKRKKKYSALDLMKAVWSVYCGEYSHCEECHGSEGNILLYAERCPHGGGIYPGRRMRMWFYLISYDMYMFVIVGTMVFQTIYFLSQPLCFSPMLVGLQLGLKFAGVAVSPFLVIFFHKSLNFSNNIIILIGFAFLLIFCVIMSFATQPYIVFVATAMTIFSNPSKPLIQAQMSSLVSEHEQGAAFALLSFSEISTFMISTVSFLTLYPATVTIYHGFAWLFAAAFILLPLLLITIIYIKDYKLEQQEGERDPLLTSR